MHAWSTCNSHLQQPQHLLDPPLSPLPEPNALRGCQTCPHLKHFSTFEYGNEIFCVQWNLRNAEWLRKYGSTYGSGSHMCVSSGAPEESTVLFWVRLETKCSLSTSVKYTCRQQWVTTVFSFSTQVYSGCSDSSRSIPVTHGCKVLDSWICHTWSWTSCGFGVTLSL